ncbi:hypothetical protein [Ruminococcus sp.]|uniref:hypothetical protein n=1 Tax=Ruminococcus sp. TaxID=41978 RepID=UPI001B092298|nr:hypothetical protein [Ruminococcus sp.]MBO5558406.1 hypothetical protein [Ruminococcus sp.]
MSRCEQCENIMVREIRSPQEYLLCANSLVGLLISGDVEMTYSTCPLGRIVDEDMKFTMGKYFHQFRCTKCGTIYGMLFNTQRGGEIRINEKVFDPADYPDKKGEGENA